MVSIFDARKVRETVGCRERGMGEGMTGEEFKGLDHGDIIRHVNSINACVVTGNYGEYVVAVKTYHVTNPNEWELVKRRKVEKGGI